MSTPTRWVLGNRVACRLFRGVSQGKPWAGAEVAPGTVGTACLCGACILRATSAVKKRFALLVASRPETCGLVLYPRGPPRSPCLH